MQSRACAPRVEFMAGYLLKFSVADTQPLHDTCSAQNSEWSSRWGHYTWQPNTRGDHIPTECGADVRWSRELVCGRDKGPADATFAIYGRRFRISSSCLLPAWFCLTSAIISLVSSTCSLTMLLGSHALVSLSWTSNVSMLSRTIKVFTKNSSESEACVFYYCSLFCLVRLPKPLASRKRLETNRKFNHGPRVVVKSWTRRIDMLTRYNILMADDASKVVWAYSSFSDRCLKGHPTLKAELDPWPRELGNLDFRDFSHPWIWVQMCSTQCSVKFWTRQEQKFLHSGKTGQCRSRTSPHASLMDMSVSLKIAEVGRATKSLS